MDLRQFIVQRFLGIVVAVKWFSHAQREGIPQYLQKLVSSEGLVIETYTIIPNWFPLYSNLETYIYDREVTGSCWIELYNCNIYNNFYCRFIPQVSQRSIKSSNFLLVDDCNAYLLDCGLAMLVTNPEANEYALQSASNKMLLDFMSRCKICGMKWR